MIRERCIKNKKKVSFCLLHVHTSYTLYKLLFSQSEHRKSTTVWEKYQSPKNLVCGYALHTGKFLRVRKVFARIEKIAYKMKPELLSALKSDYLKTFRTVRKLSRLSGNFPNCLETSQTVWKLSGQSGKLPDCPESLEDITFDAYVSRKQFTHIWRIFLLRKLITHFVRKVFARKILPTGKF